MIESQIPAGNLQQIKIELEGENDFQSIQKIGSTISRLQYTKEDVAKLLQEMKTLFLVDGKFDQLERSMSMALRRVLL